MGESIYEKVELQKFYKNLYKSFIKNVYKGFIKAHKSFMKAL